MSVLSLCLVSILVFVVIDCVCCWFCVCLLFVLFILCLLIEVYVTLAFVYFVTIDVFFL